MSQKTTLEFWGFYLKKCIIIINTTGNALKVDPEVKPLLSMNAADAGSEPNIVDPHDILQHGGCKVLQGIVVLEQGTRVNEGSQIHVGGAAANERWVSEKRAHKSCRRVYCKVAEGLCGARGALVLSLLLGRRDVFVLTNPNSQEKKEWACSSEPHRGTVLSFPSAFCQTCTCVPLHLSSLELGGRAHSCKHNLWPLFTLYLQPTVCFPFVQLRMWDPVFDGVTRPSEEFTS